MKTRHSDDCEKRALVAKDFEGAFPKAAAAVCVVPSLSVSLLLIRRFLWKQLLVREA